ncbi:MAG: hypothetical protein FD139_2093 [Methylocystaceae bacterium]|nr:MAG: hypothetical protein FD172_3048 [Methylocystaceae bacterium]TXT44662.1 MAG: hypothetical protein FD139_2093 [Methylocystaceae bacterium]
MTGACSLSKKSRPETRQRPKHNCTGAEDRAQSPLDVVTFDHRRWGPKPIRCAIGGDACPAAGRALGAVAPLRRCAPSSPRVAASTARLPLTLRLKRAVYIEQPDYSDGGDREPGRQLAVPANAVEAWREGRQVERIARNTRPKPRRFSA